ncbi:MAG: hypothetical protein KAX65_01300 [Caldilineaceae bacterium]|nr:hypothetical protein [Caldilineaceae bacterium]
MEQGDNDQIGATIDHARNAVVGKDNHQQVVHVDTHGDLRMDQLERRVLALEIDKQIRGNSSPAGRILVAFSVLVALGLLAINLYFQFQVWIR